MIILFSIACVGSFFWLLWFVRRNKLSLGLPIAYLYSLLLIHLPGAYARIVGQELFVNSDLVEIAMGFTALGSICFVLGVWWSRRSVKVVKIHQGVYLPRFWRFCVIAGWTCIYGLSPFFAIPSIGAAVDKGGAIWMLGVMLGLRAALQRNDQKWIALWTGALMVYPLLMLLLGGFLSYGAQAIILVCSALTISTRAYWKVLAGVVVFSFVSLSIFVNYFEHRTEIRKEVWGGAPLEDRINSVIDTGKDFEWFNPSSRRDLIALDERLNQNYFVGLAARRLETGQVQYLKGESLWEGLLALVPRALWPEKPVSSGSPKIVSKMTGLRLSNDTSFGVGNVMEFQINFGIPGVVSGFFLLGWLIGILDHKAALAENQGRLGETFFSFLPCVALIQPNGSLVELFSGSAAALVAAYGWNIAWKWLGRKRTTGFTWAPAQHRYHIEGPSYNKKSST